MLIAIGISLVVVVAMGLSMLFRPIKWRCYCSPMHHYWSLFYWPVWVVGPNKRGVFRGLWHCRFMMLPLERTVQANHIQNG